MATLSIVKLWAEPYTHDRHILASAKPDTALTPFQQAPYLGNRA